MSKRRIRICLGSSCFTRGNNANLEVIRKYIADNGLDARVDFSGRHCEEKCARGPVVCIDDHVYEQVNLSRLHKILKEEFAC
mgnify:CR=1 FL=1